MKITCHSCQAKYTVSDEKVQGKTVKMKCRKCGATIVINSAGVSTTSVNAESVPIADQQAYLVNVADGDQRTLNTAEIAAAYVEGLIDADTFVWADSMEDWQPLGQVARLVDAVNEALAEAEAESAVLIEPEPSLKPTGSVEPTNGASPSQTLSSSVLGAASASLQAKSQSTPVPFAPSPPKSNSGSLLSAPAPTGQRDENSVLFSLGALTAKASSPPSIRPASSEEDSGIIDLKAIAASSAAAAGPASSVAPLSIASIVPEEGGLFGVSAPPAGPGASVQQTVAQSRPASSVPKVVGGAIAAIALVLGGVLFLRPQGAPAPIPDVESAGVAPSAEAQAVSPTATAEAPTQPAATPDTEPSSTASAVAAPKGRGRGRASGTAPRKGAEPADPTPAPAAPAAPAKPAGGGAKGGNCGCSASDLMCAMRCSAKGK